MVPDTHTKAPAREANEASREQVLVYLDHAATTPVLEQVREAMFDALGGTFGNPANSSHELGRAASSALDLAREQVAALIGAPAGCVYFTSGATEANNLAIRGVVHAAQRTGSTRRAIAVGAIEHRSILCPMEELVEEGSVAAHVVAVSPAGVLDLAALEQVLVEHEVLLVCVQLANNEIGTIQPVREAVRLAHAHGALVLCDATQAVGKMPIDVVDLDVDLLSLSAHKFHGPKGAGALFVAADVELDAQLTGGGQERGMRAGTPNVPAIIGMGVAADAAREHVTDGTCARIERQRDRIEAALLAACPTARINGADAPRLPGICSVTVSGCCGGELVASLPELAISRGSACSTGSARPSHVLTALGHTPEDAFATLRLSLGATTSDADVDRAIAALERCLPDTAAPQE